MAKDNSLKTGKLPKEFKKKWVKALRSGKGKQGFNMLYNPHEDSFCCLGIAEVVAGSRLEKLRGYGTPIGMEKPNTPKLLCSSFYTSPVAVELAGLNDSKIPFEVIGFIQENL